MMERFLNDLWKYDPVLNQWTWVNGDLSAMAPGVYGTKGVPAASNNPGSRALPVSWMDASDNFWIMGGSGPNGNTNDLWRYHPATDEWTWMTGANTPNGSGIYISKGLEHPASTPGFRFFHNSWKDASGNFWLMGGIEYGFLNDLWKYNPATNIWTWMSGEPTSSYSGVYGTKGVPTPVNTPGARYLHITWNDVAGNLYLFGGNGYDGYNNSGAMNDVWKYNIGFNEWTWVNGASLYRLPTIHGTRGIGSSATRPAYRIESAAASDGDNLYLFGGYGQDGNGYYGALSDLWQYNTTTRQWTWIGGNTTANNGGIYGTKGVAAAANRPGSRSNSSLWADGGNIWLFGGLGYDRNNTRGTLNDLWKFSIATGLWTWVSGDDVVYQSATFGTRGLLAPSNKPGSRLRAVNWKDAAGNLWLFGGASFATGEWNDLWRYEPTSNQWVWVHGDNISNQIGNYGTKGIASAANKPSSRNSSVAAATAAGRVFLFGGSGYGTSGYGTMNDLWEFNMITNEWTWISGDATFYHTGVYGTKGVPAAANKPGARASSTSWADANGNFWLYGGSGSGNMSDLWKYDGTTGNWTWVTGNSTGNQAVSYGTLGVPSVTNTPGSRWGMMSWSQPGRLWLFGGSAGNGDLWSFADFGTLPLVWKNFTARKNGNAALLEWQTASEQDVKDFVIERSANGQQFDSIGKVSARNQLSLMSYSFIDRDPLSGKNFYRIRENGKDGISSHSRILMVAFARDQIITWTQSGKQVRVQLTGGNSDSYTLFDGNGRMVQQGMLQQGMVQFNALTPGLYILEAKSRNEIFSQKMLVR